MTKSNTIPETEIHELQNIANTIYTIYNITSRATLQKIIDLFTKPNYTDIELIFTTINHTIAISIFRERVIIHTITNNTNNTNNKSVNCDEIITIHNLNRNQFVYKFIKHILQKYKYTSN